MFSDFFCMIGSITILTICFIPKIPSNTVVPSLNSVVKVSTGQVFYVIHSSSKNLISLFSDPLVRSARSNRSTFPIRSASRSALFPRRRACSRHSASASSLSFLKLFARCRYVEASASAFIARSIASSRNSSASFRSLFSQSLSERSRSTSVRSSCSTSHSRWYITSASSRSTRSWSRSAVIQTGQTRPQRPRSASL